MSRSAALPGPLPADAGRRRDIALFLDIDGTIAEIAPRPELAAVPNELRPILAVLSDALDGAVALVSGRTIADIDRMLPWANLAVAGTHGLERRRPGERVASAPADAGLRGVAAALRAFCDSRPGLILEDKGGAVALHYRQRPEIGDAVRTMAIRLTDANPRLVALEGKAVIEIKPDGRNKGSAIRDFMTEAPFAGRTPVFIGDDVTDEPGFAAVRELGGVAIRVGEERETLAEYRLPDVGTARDWLRGLADWFGDG